jgi:hypothetical protein
MSEIITMLEQQFPEISKARTILLDHPLYGAIDSIPRLRWFMEDHVFAVWDFMSLAKRLQRELTCVQLPWMPVADASLARFINDVVLAEESDKGLDGRPLSHLEIYLRGMEEVGADMSLFQEFLALLRSGQPLDKVFDVLPIPTHVRRFVGRTINRALHGDPVEVVADFLFGREDLIPYMFARLLKLWDGTGCSVPTFQYYLERHIALDGDEHGPAARRMLQAMAGDDTVNWEKAATAALEAIYSRMNLWDGVLRKIRYLESPRINPGRWTLALQAA